MTQRAGTTGVPPLLHSWRDMRWALFVYTYIETQIIVTAWLNAHYAMAVVK